MSRNQFGRRERLGRRSGAERVAPDVSLTAVEQTITRRADSVGISPTSALAAEREERLKDHDPKTCTHKHCQPSPF